MDSADASQVPARSARWAHVAASRAADVHTETPPGPKTPPRRADDAASLRDRLLRMIIANEHARQRGAEALKPR